MLMKKLIAVLLASVMLMSTCPTLAEMSPASADLIAQVDTQLSNANFSIRIEDLSPPARELLADRLLAELAHAGAADLSDADLILNRQHAEQELVSALSSAGTSLQEQLSSNTEAILQLIHTQINALDIDSASKAALAANIFETLVAHSQLLPEESAVIRFLKLELRDALVFANAAGSSLPERVARSTKTFIDEINPIEHYAVDSLISVVDLMNTRAAGNICTIIMSMTPDELETAAQSLLNYYDFLKGMNAETLYAQRSAHKQFLLETREQLAALALDVNHITYTDSQRIYEIVRAGLQSRFGLTDEAMLHRVALSISRNFADALKAGSEKGAFMTHLSLALVDSLLRCGADHRANFDAHVADLRTACANGHPAMIRDELLSLRLHMFSDFVLHTIDTISHMPESRMHALCRQLMGVYNAHKNAPGSQFPLRAWQIIDETDLSSLTDEGLEALKTQIGEVIGQGTDSMDPAMKEQVVNGMLQTALARGNLTMRERIASYALASLLDGYLNNADEPHAAALDEAMSQLMLRVQSVETMNRMTVQDFTNLLPNKEFSALVTALNQAPHDQWVLVVHQLTENYALFRHLDREQVEYLAACHKSIGEQVAALKLNLRELTDSDLADIEKIVLDTFSKNHLLPPLELASLCVKTTARVTTMMTVNQDVRNAYGALHALLLNTLLEGNADQLEKLDFGFHLLEHKMRELELNI